MPTATQMNSVTLLLITYVLYLLYSVASERMTPKCPLWQQLLCKLENFLHVSMGKDKGKFEKMQASNSILLIHYRHCSFLQD